MKHFSVHLFLGIIMLINSNLVMAEDWKLVLDKNGIQVFTQDIDDSKHHRFKAVGTVNTSVESLVYLMRDPVNMDQWLHSCYDIKVVEDIDPATRLFHMKNETPIIVKDRDLVLVQRMMRVADDHVIVELVSKPDAVPEQKKYVRVPMFEGAWNLKQIDANSSWVEYHGFGDPGGNVPAWVANVMIADTPYKTLRKLQQQVYDPYSGQLDFLLSMEQAELDESRQMAGM